MSERQDDSRRLFLLLVGTDALLIVLGILHVYAGVFAAEAFSIEKERGFGESFQYLKELWICLLLCALGWKARSRLHLSFALLFAYFLADDTYRLHERLGAALARFSGLSTVLGMRAAGLGEIVVLALCTGLIFAAILRCYLRTPPAQRAWARKLTARIAVLALFGVVIDGVHINITNPAWDAPLGILEDGGELVVMTVILAFVFRLRPSVVEPRGAPAGGGEAATTSALHAPAGATSEAEEARKLEPVW